MNKASQIKGAELVVQRFGDWPSFHDAEIIWLRLDRQGPTFEFMLHAFEATNEINNQGQYALTNHSLIHFRCDQMSEISIEGFNHQNVIFEIEIENIRQEGCENDDLMLTINPSFGVAAIVNASVIEVVSIVPCDANGIADQI